MEVGAICRYFLGCDSFAGDNINSLNQKFQLWLDLLAQKRCALGSAHKCNIVVSHFYSLFMHI